MDFGLSCCLNETHNSFFRTNYNILQTQFGFNGRADKNKELPKLGVTRYATEETKRSIPILAYPSD